MLPNTKLQLKTICKLKEADSNDSFSRYICKAIARIPTLLVVLSYELVSLTAGKCLRQTTSTCEEY